MKVVIFHAKALEEFRELPNLSASPLERHYGYCRKASHSACLLATDAQRGARCR